MNEQLQQEIEKYITEKHLKSEAFLVSSIAEHFYNLALEDIKKQKEPKFKVGDRISRKGKPHEYIFTVQEVLDDCYILDDDKILTFNWEDEWELVQDEPKKLAQTWIGPDGKECARSNGISAEVGDKDTIYEVVDDKLAKGHDPDYLQSCIDKAKESWKGVDVDKFMDDVRGRGNGQGQAENATTSDDLAEEIDAVSKRYPEVFFAKLSRIAKHFAEWQVKKLRKNCDIIDREYAKAMQESTYEKGRTDMREQMMKEAKPINPKYISGSALDGIKKGDKCYLLVVKDDETRDS